MEPVRAVPGEVTLQVRFDGERYTFQQFWQLRSSIGTFSIACGQDTIPWELLYPLSPGQDEGFLVEQFPVLRRVYGQRRSRRVSVTPSVYVVPAGSPANAGQEIDALRHRLGASSEEVCHLDRLLDLIGTGTGGLLHFACHSTFRADAGGSSITMGGGDPEATATVATAPPAAPGTTGVASAGD